MVSQQFCLKWSNHQSNMLSMFEQLLSNEALMDVTLACEGLSLKAHKMVLSACSPYFQALFIENPCKHPIVILKDVSYIDLKAIVEFMYRGEVNVSLDHLTAFLKTAQTLKVKGLVEVTNENERDELVTSVDGAADTKPVDTPRDVSSPLGKRKRGRRRRCFPSDSNKSGSEDVKLATPIMGPESPEIIEDGGVFSDRMANLPADSPSRRAFTVATASAHVPSGALLGSSVQATPSRRTQDSIDDDMGECDDVEPLNVIKQPMTTENVLVFPDVASSSQAVGDESQPSHHKGSTSDISALVPVLPLLASDIQVDIKPLPSSLIPYDDQTISPVAASPAAALSGDGASTSVVMDASDVQAIAGPSNYQQSTPSLGSAATWSRGGLPQQQVLTEESPLFLCTECSYSTVDPTDFKQHQRRHAGQHLFRCSNCSKSFTKKYSLTDHLRIHTGERPHQCSHCRKSFAARRTLDEHLRVHTGEKPYQCKLCPMAFTKNFNLNRHIQTHEC